MASVEQRHDSTTHHSLWAAMIRLLLLFTISIFWAIMLSIAYAYRSYPTGLLGWIRLPNGIAPFEALNLAMADVVAFAALFVAILIAATVQQNSTVAAAESIVDEIPESVEEARQQQKALKVYSNQAEVSMLVSFGAVFGVLMLASLFGLQEMAIAGAADATVDQHGVGWAGFFKSAHTLLHPRVIFLYFVALLLLMTTYASMPSWKNTGLFRRQVEDNAWEASERLKLIAREHDLDNVQPIKHPVGAAVATAVGYLGYVVLFTLALNGILVLLASADGFESLLTSENAAFLGAFSLVAITISTTVANIALKMMHLQGQNNALLSISLATVLGVILYVVYAEGVTWTIALAIAIAGYASWWYFLYWRATRILDEKNPHTWEFLINPPKYIVMRRYEQIRSAAAQVTNRDTPAELVKVPTQTN